MANNLKEINDVVKKCKILLLDIEGTTTSISFVKDKLFPYAEENVKKFLDSQWENEDVKESVNALRKLALEDKEKSVDGVIVIPGEDASKEDQIEGLVNNVKWQMSSDRKVGPLKQLQGLIWKQGYDNGDIKGHVYDDVMPALEQWRSIDGQKVYIYSSGSVEAQKLLFGQSLAGDLLKFIDGHFDTAVGAKQEASSYKAIIEKIGCPADEVLFLTDVVKEAEAARSAGLCVALVSREGNATISEEAANTYPVIQTFSQLTVSNKRKTEPQEEQPAKIPKTNTNDVKTETEPSKVLPEKKAEAEADAEKMEVDDPVTEESTAKEVKVETVIEEVTDSKEIDAPVCDIEPIVIEEGVDKMETETVQGSDVTEKKVDPKVEKTASKDVTEKEAPKETVDVKEGSPVTEEALPAVVTEIEEITSEKESLADVSEIIDGLEPVVEEPATAAEMEDLQNVGEELEKECDEILSKMSDVSNLENIQAKPILKPIIEDPMEVEVPTDAVDKVLEEKVEMKASKDKPSEAHSQTKDKSTDEVSMETDISKDALPKAGVKTEETNGDKEKVEPKHKNEVKDVEKEDDKGAQSKVVKETQTDAKEVLVAEVKETQKTEIENESQAKNSVDTAKEKPLDADKVAEPKETIKSDPKEATVENKQEATVENKPEFKLNGNATNGKPVSQNGVEKSNEIKARLSAENGKESNGSNGTNDSQKGQDDSKVEELSEIKVKTLAKEEPRPDPIKQATEA